MLRLALLAPILLVVAPAHAATLDFSASTLNGSTVTDLGGPGSLSLEIDVRSPLPIGLAVDLEPGDGPVAFQASVFNFLPRDLTSYVLTLSGGAVFSVLGDANDSQGRAAVVGGGTSLATIDFAIPEPVLFTIGNPVASGAQDWQIDVSGVTSGSFGLTLAVPEPAPAILLAMASAAGALARRRLGDSAG